MPFLIGFIVLIMLLLGIVVVTAISIYNGIVSLRNQVDRAWANIDVILKQRFDEIPQLIQILEQYVQYEKHIIQAVMDARSHYGAAHSSDDKIKASQEMSLALKGVFAIGENYPELKSNANFTHIQQRLSSLEDHLADRREVFNEAVTNWNTRIAQFPDVLLTGVLNLSPRDLYQINEKEKSMPSLKMNLGS